MHMITLCGLAISNYHNKVKLAMLEKGVPFHEETAIPGQEKSFLDKSPLGKIPFIQTELGFLSESQVILEYLEEAYPAKPLYPSGAFERAKCRELINHLELNIELQARRLYGEVFFGTPVAEVTKEEVKKNLEVALKGFAQLAKFSPYVFGSEFTAADCSAWVHFPMVSMATEKVLGENMLLKYLPAAAGYSKLLQTRPHVIKASADKDIATAAFFSAK